MRKRTLAVIAAIAIPRASHAQGPIFLTPANTTPVSDVSPAVSYIRKGGETDLNIQAAYGVLPRLTLGVGLLMVVDDGRPLELARVQTQVKYRLFQRIGDGKRTVVGMGAGFGVPFAESVNRVARANGISSIVGSLTAAHVERRTGLFAGVQYTRDAHDIRGLHTATAGVAASWRFKPAPPGATSGPGFTLFLETLGHYEGDHSGWFALAPGIMYRIGRTQVKLGTRIPLQRWNSHSSRVLSLGTSMFIPVKSSRQ